MFTNIIHTLSGSLRAKIGRVPQCAWIQTRLGSFHDWELSTREMEAVEKHLHSCSDCARDYEEICDLRQLFDRAYPLPALAESSSEQRTADIMAFIKVHDEEPLSVTMRRAPSNAGRRFAQPLNRRPRLATAACLLVAVALPIFAGIGVMRSSLPAPATVAKSASPGSIELRTPAAPHPATGRASGATSSETTAPYPQELADSAGDSATFDDILARQVAMAEVEAILPHTEEEYEAWARREYPHIMWLYDVLMGEVPKGPADSPAGHMVSFGVDDAGNPTITLPDAHDDPATFTFAIPDGSSEGEPLWDGLPTNIPAWGKRLYAHTPTQKHPIGWRALVVYSADIFKLDWPEGLGDPSVLPSVEALRESARVVRCGRDDGVPARAPMDDSIGGPPLLQLPNGYVEALAADIPSASSMTAHICVSALIVGTSRSLDLADFAKDTLVRLSAARGTRCGSSSVINALTNLLRNREECIGCVVGTSQLRQGSW